MNLKIFLLAALAFGSASAASKPTDQYKDSDIIRDASKPTDQYKDSDIIRDASKPTDQYKDSDIIRDASN